MKFIEKHITQNENDNLTKTPNEKEIHNNVLGMELGEFSFEHDE